jgi:hypothetical protein
MQLVPLHPGGLVARGGRVGQPGRSARHPRRAGAGGVCWCRVAAAERNRSWIVFLGGRLGGGALSLHGRAAVQVEFS